MSNPADAVRIREGKDRKPVHLAAHFPGVNNTTVWSDPASGSQIDFDSFVHLARTAERGLFDFSSSPRGYACVSIASAFTISTSSGGPTPSRCWRRSAPSPNGSGWWAPSIPPSTNHSTWHGNSPPWIICRTGGPAGTWSPRPMPLPVRTFGAVAFWTTPTVTAVPRNSSPWRASSGTAGTRRVSPAPSITGVRNSPCAASQPLRPPRSGTLCCCRPGFRGWARLRRQACRCPVHHSLLDPGGAEVLHRRQGPRRCPWAQSGPAQGLSRCHLRPRRHRTGSDREGRVHPGSAGGPADRHRLSRTGVGP